MSMIDDLLGPPAEHRIEDGGGGEWIVEIRPRRSGPPVVRTTMVRFRRPEQRGAFGIQVHVLREVARIGLPRDPILESSIGPDRTAARNAVKWLDHFNRGSRK